MFDSVRIYHFRNRQIVNDTHTAIAFHPNRIRSSANNRVYSRRLRRVCTDPDKGISRNRQGKSRTFLVHYTAHPRRRDQAVDNIRNLQDNSHKSRLHCILRLRTWHRLDKPHNPLGRLRNLPILGISDQCVQGECRNGYFSSRSCHGIHIGVS